MSETATDTTVDLTDEWATPPDFWAAVEAEFKPDLDVCATAENSKCEFYFAPTGYDPPRGATFELDFDDHPIGGPACAGIDGLESEWRGVCFCNPGFSNLMPWMKKAAEASASGATCLVVSHAAHAAEWARFAMAHATECRLLVPRVEYLPAPGVKRSRNTRDGMLWVFRPRWHRKVGAHVYVWRWAEAGPC